MICPKCGCEITGNYCSNCGMPLKTEEKDSFVDEISEESAGMSYEGMPWEEIPEYGEPGVAEDRPTERIEDLRLSREDVPSRPRRSRKKEDNGSTAKSSKKEIKKKDARLKKMESELTQLRDRAEESRKSLERMETLRRENDEIRQRSAGREPEALGRGKTRAVAVSAEEDTKRKWKMTAGRRADQNRCEDQSGNADRTGTTFQAVKAAGAGAVVLISRLMQLASAFLMAAMTAVMLRSFWKYGQGLGDIRYVLEERNYALALYAGFAGVSLFMGFIWFFWILSRKGAGGGIRMKKYDIGRGFLPFLLCMAVVVAAGAVLLKFPKDAVIWNGHLKGAYAALEAVCVHRNGLFFSSVLGAVLSFIRKLLRV